MKKLIAVLVATMTLTVSTAYADAYGEAIWAFNSGNVKPLKRLALDGDVHSQIALGFFLILDKDYTEAVKWYKLAAAQGNAEAQFNLGVMYYEGRGVAQDYVIAHLWLNLAAAQGNKNAEGNRDLVAKKMTQLQIAEAQKLARECLARKYKGC